MPTTGAQAVCGKINMVRKGKSDIAPPTSQNSFECRAGTIPKKWRPTMIAITGIKYCFALMRLSQTAAVTIATISSVTKIP